MASRYSSEVLVVVTATEWDSAPTVSTLRMALYGGVYEDTENPSGAKQHYQGRIRSDVILDKKIGVSFWQEDSEIDFGYVDLAVEDQDADLIDFAKNVTIAAVDVYRIDLNSAQLEKIASARTSDIGFTSEDSIRLRLESSLQGGFDAPINELYYSGTGGTAGPVQLEGKPFPIAWAFTADPEQLIPTVFVDDTTLSYHITDLEISSIEGSVYDRGIALTEPTEFITTTYGFELQQNPDGRITAGRVLLVDPEDTASEFKYLFPFVRLAMTRTGLWANANETELTALQTDINKGEIYPQFFSADVVSLKDFLDDIFNGTGSWYSVDELDEIHFGRLTDPDVETPTLAFNDGVVIGEIRVNDDKAPGLSTRISHGENPGRYEQDELAGAVTNADRMLMTNEIYTNETTETVISFYAKAAAREPTKLAMSYGEALVGFEWTADATFTVDDDTTHTADGSGGSIGIQTSEWIAQAEVDRWWSDLYPKRRRFYTFDVQLNDPLFDDDPLPQLGDFCTLQSDRFLLLETAKNLLIRRVRFNFSDNLLTIEGWG